MYMENSKESMIKILEVIHEFSKVSSIYNKDTKINYFFKLLQKIQK